MYPLLWIAAGAASSLGWKLARRRQDEEQAVPEAAPVEVAEAPPPGLLRRGALYVAMGFVTAGRWVRSAGSAIFFSRASRSESKPEKLQEPR